MTLAAQNTQGIQVLEDKPITEDDIHFLGEPDPRTSRYGEGLRPSAEAAQTTLLVAQGKRIGEIACKGDKPVVAVLHDMRAGAAAIQNGCGKILLALDGHTHAETGPTSIALPTGQTARQFTGGSAGGAPNETEASEANPFEHLTIGKLEHNAHVYIVSVNVETGELAGLTGITYTPDQTVSATRLYETGEYVHAAYGYSAEGQLPQNAASAIPTPGK
jgi:hypothetical protein